MSKPRTARANPAGTTQYGRTEDTRGVNRHGEIPAGKCGWRGCDEPRQAGVWKLGGSYMCVYHAARLLHIRALWDKTSPQAMEMRNNIDYEAELKALKYEETKERNA